MNFPPTIVSGGIAVIAVVLYLIERATKKQMEKSLADAKENVVKAQAEAKAEIGRAHSEAKEALAKAQRLIDAQRTEINQEGERIKLHYQTEALKLQAASDSALETARKELASLERFIPLVDAEAETRTQLTEALKEAAGLREDAHALLARSREAAAEERAGALRKAKEIHAQADALLDQATRDSAKMAAEAHLNAEKIAGDAYAALRDKDNLEGAAKAIQNVIDGYGDRYIIPTRSLVDDLAADFGHAEAGRALAAAREQSRRIVEEGHASECDYAEANRRQTAIRFVVDAFNGRVDAILSRSKNDNFGTLDQEIRDAFSMVNLNGKAFRDARILPSYLEARLAELKWAVVVQELRHKEREEQRRIKEQMREEEKARREYERAIQEAEQEESSIKRALDKARSEVEQATVEQRAKFEQEIALLNQRLAEAEAKNQRALSMAQQTRKGNVYVVSNAGSFGEGVFKIGMTRRLEPLDRIKELGDASVPFGFDVHAMIASDDAPALEALLHAEFDDGRINKVNYRKEFFRVALDQVRGVIATKGIEASFTMLAEAHEFRETQVLNKMTPEEREKYHLSRDSDNGDD